MRQWPWCCVFRLMIVRLLGVRPCFLIGLIFLAGCPATAPEENDAPPLEGHTVDLVVIDDPQLADAAELLATEWTSRTGARLNVQRLTNDQVPSAKLPDPSVVLYPSSLLGTLLSVESGPRPQVFPEESSESETGWWNGVFDLNRFREARWNGKQVAVPVGSPVLVCFFRPDVLQKAEAEPPETWTEYQLLVQRLAEDSTLREGLVVSDKWYGTAEPRGPGQAGLTLLARAASYAKHPDYYSTLFDIESMEPRIVSPALVRALDELSAAWKHAAPAELSGTPEACHAAIRAGHCGLALGWATREEAPAGEPKAVWDVALLPGSREVFNIKDNEFRPLPEVRRVPLVGWSGRLASMVSATPPGTQDHSKFEAQQLLIQMLMGEEWGTQFSAASSHTTLFRHSQIPMTGEWMSPATPLESAESYGEKMAESLLPLDVLYALRIPGRTEYLQALDLGVQRAVSGEATSQQALEEAAKAWTGITNKLGLEQQKKLYRRSVMGSY